MRSISSACSNVTTSYQCSPPTPSYHSSSTAGLPLKREGASDYYTSGCSGDGVKNEVVDFVKRYTPIYKRQVFTLEQQRIIQTVSPDQINKLNDLMGQRDELDSTLYDQIYQELIIGTPPSRLLVKEEFVRVADTAPDNASATNRHLRCRNNKIFD